MIQGQVWRRPDAYFEKLTLTEGWETQERGKKGLRKATFEVRDLGSLNSGDKRRDLRESQETNEGEYGKVDMREKSKCS